MVMRISGLASGMDIDSLVDKLMKAERMPLDKMMQKQQTYEWQRDDYRDMNLLLKELDDAAFQMKMQSSFLAKTSTSSNENVVTATALPAESNASYSITEISQLATAASKVGGSVSSTTTGGKIDPTKSLMNETNFASGITWSSGVLETKNLTSNGQPLKITDDTIDKKPNAIAPGQYVTNMSVKVDGVSYQVIYGPPPADTSTIGDNQVYLDSSNYLTFNSSLASGKSITVDYVKSGSFTDTVTASADGTTFNLSKGSIEGSSLANKQITVTDNSTGTPVPKTFTVNATTDSNGNYSFTSTDGDGKTGSIDPITGKMIFDNFTVQKGSTITLDYTQKYMSFSLGSYDETGKKTETFLVEGNKSLNDVISQINSSSLGLTAYYDSFSDKFTLTRNEAGNFHGAGPNANGDFSSADTEFDTSDVFFSDVLKFSTAKEYGGTNAEFTINGLTTQRTSNTFDMNGVTFTLKGKLDATAPAITVSSNTDTDTIYDNIKKFVDKYNEVIEKLNSKISEPRYRDYQPLSNEQKEAMSDKQVEMWEEKAKSGLLRNDSIISSGLNRMRMDLYSSVSGVSSGFNQLAEIGITTSNDFTQHGKLIINETKLKAAINKDPNAVMELFTKSGSTFGSTGLADRVRDTLDGVMDNIVERAGNSSKTNQQFTIGKNLDDMKDRIDAFQEKLKDIEARYYRQFNAMEQAIQRANSQSMYLMQQFGGQ